MATLPLVDTHVHYWDLKDPTLRYDWLQPEWIHPILGNIDGLKVLRYGAEHYVAETRFQNVSKAVHVQAAIGIADPVEETKWLQAQADELGFPHAIVGHCDLAGDDAEETLERTRTSAGSATSGRATCPSRRGGAATHGSPSTISSSASTPSGRTWTRRAAWRRSIPA